MNKILTPLEELEPTSEPAQVDIGPLASDILHGDPSASLSHPDDEAWNNPGAEHDPRVASCLIDSRTQKPLVLGPETQEGLAARELGRQSGLRLKQAFCPDLDNELNPNPNPSGLIELPTDPEVMKEHIRNSQALALVALKAELAVQEDTSDITSRGGRHPDEHEMVPNTELVMALEKGLEALQRVANLEIENHSLKKEVAHTLNGLTALDALWQALSSSRNYALAGHVKHIGHIFQGKA